VFLPPPGGRPRISKIGTDLRAVRPRGTGCRECLPRRVALHCPVRRSGAFGEIALPRRCMGKAEFAEGPRLYSPMTSEVLGLGGVCGRTPGCSRMTSEVGTDLRAVRPRGIACRECLAGRFA